MANRTQNPLMENIKSGRPSISLWINSIVKKGGKKTMKIKKVSVWQLVGPVLLTMALIASVGMLSSVVADEYPTRPVRIVVPFSVGGIVDITTRAIEPFLKEALGAPAIVIEDKPGGGTTVGTLEVATRKADGYTLLHTGIDHMTLTNFTIPERGYETEDFVPVVVDHVDARNLFVSRDSPIDNFDEFVEAARQRPGKITVNYTTGGMGQWMIEYLKKELDLPIRLVGYPGGKPARVAVMGGHVTAYSGGGKGTVAYKDRLKCIGTYWPTSTAVWPEAPSIAESKTIKEAGIEVPGLGTAMLGTYWVHREVKENYPERYYKLVWAFYEVAKNPEFQKKCKESGLDKILVWYPPEKAGEIAAGAKKLLGKHPDIIERLLKK